MSDKKEEKKTSKLDKAAQLATVAGGLGAIGGVAHAIASTAKSGEDVGQETKKTIHSIRRKGLKVGPIPVKTGEQVAREKKAKEIKKQRRKQAVSKQRQATMSNWPKWRKNLNKFKKLGGGKWLFESVEQKKDTLALAEFLFSQDWQETYKEAKRIGNKGKRIAKKGRFIGDTIRDIDEHRRGVRTNKRRKRVWERRGVKDAAIGTAALGTAALVGMLARKKGIKIEDAWKAFEAKDQELVELKEDWYTSRATGSSVRVHHKGQRRQRRKKKWHERKENRDRMWAATAAGLPIAGALAHKAGVNRAFTRLVRTGGVKQTAQNVKRGKFQDKIITPDINEENIPRSFRGKVYNVGKKRWEKKEGVTQEKQKPRK